MKTGQLLTIEIPESATARIGVLVLAILSYSSIYWVVSFTLSTQSSGETSGEAVMARGAFFITMGPIAAGMALISASFSSWKRKSLSVLWRIVGISPAFALIPAAAFIVLRFGKI